MTDRDILALTLSAGRRWMDNWVAGPTLQGDPARRGDKAPDLELTAEDGARVNLSLYWSDRPALVMLWRHLGCGCGLDRIERLKKEYGDYLAYDLNPVVVAPGEIERVVAYKQRYGLPAPILADPDYMTHKAFGLSHWSQEQLLYDADEKYCTLTEETGKALQAEKKELGRSLVDDPWMQSAEFVVDTDGIVKVAYLYNYCEDYPDPNIYLTAARMAS